MPAKKTTFAVAAGAWRQSCKSLREENIRAHVAQTGEVVCWGDNTVGEVAENGGASISRPRAISRLTPAASLGLGFYHVCVVTEDDDVVCWGRNESGQLGTGSTTMREPTPVRARGI